jgi:hypothetical protein
MKTFVGVFTSSAVFAVSIALVYWYASRDHAGTLLLGFMFLAFSWVAGYSLVTERGSDLAGDDAQAQHKERAGEDLGIVTKDTPWPLLLALSILCLFVGIIWSDFLLFTGLGSMLICLWRLGAESARVGYKRVMTEEGPENAT